MNAIKQLLTRILQLRKDILQIFDATYPGGTAWICWSGLTQTFRRYRLDRLPKGQKVQLNFLGLLSIFLASSVAGISQEVLTGKILEKDAAGKESPLGMAGIKWLGTTITATTNENGEFNIPFPDSVPSKLIVGMISYRADTILFKDRSKTFIKVILKTSAQTLNEVKILGKQNATSNLTTTTMNTELLSQKELTNAACCNLSESFERNASVDVNFTDAISGTKQIQMLGLDGIYTQILYENLPFVRGLSASHGLTYIPGPWVESILVTKGSGSVVNGYESITGQIQIEILEPDKADRFFINGYGSTDNRFELNMHKAKQFSESLSTLFFTHVSRNNLYDPKNMDKNKDGFLDIPLSEQYNIFNRWHYRIKNKAEGQFGVRALVENKTGGQMNNNATDSSGIPYTIGINTRQFETFTKNGFLFPSKPWKSIAIMTTERYHKLDALFGVKKFDGEQKSLYVNTIWADIINNTNHKIKFGGSLVLDQFEETLFDGTSTISDSIHRKQEIVPGGYAEYTFNNDTNLSIVAGIRADFFDDIGLMVNPRLHMKYNTSKESSFRLSGGRGIRTPHIFVENSSILASSRQIVILENLLPEIAWNYGMTFNYCFKIFKKEATFNIDLFRTDFENQVVVDLEDVNKVQFYNLKGISYSNSLQTELGITPLKGMDIKLAYKYYDVKTTYSGKLLDKPLVPRDRALINIDYATHAEKWKFNFTAKWFGSSRLPNTSANPAEFQRAERSPSYYTLMSQVTKRHRQFEFYLGGENLLNFKIKNPIIDPLNPYGTNFDATMIWGPIYGRMIYGGLRYNII